MSTFLYSRPSDRLTGTITASAADAEYPASNLNDGEPQKPAKLTTTTGNWVQDFTSAQQVDLVGLIHTNFQAALAVQIQGHTADSWAAPDVNQSFTIPAPYGDNFSVNVWLNLKSLVPVDANRTKRYWRLNVSGTNSAPIAVGEWLMYGTRRDFGVRNIKKGSARTFYRPAKIHETDGLVRKRYDIGTTIRSVEVETEATDATLSEIEALWRSARGAVNGFPIVPHSSESEMWFVTFVDTNQPYERTNISVNTVKMEFIELSRGLYL